MSTPTATLAGPAQRARAVAGARIGLVVLALAQLEIAVWGEVSPHGFWQSFPGMGHHWVAPMGPYDEHLVRDYAGAEFGFAVLLLCAAVWCTRPVVRIALLAFVAGTLPHLIYHCTTTAMLSTGDNVASLGAFAIELLIAAVVAALIPPGAAVPTGPVAPPPERTAR